MPDHTHILNEFIWQTKDVWPDIPRVHTFLNYWYENIDAVINEVLVQHCNETKWRHIDIEQRMK